MVTMVYLNGRLLAEGTEYSMVDDEPVLAVPVPPGSTVQVIAVDGGASERHDVYDTPATEAGTVSQRLTDEASLDVPKPRRRPGEFTLSKRA